MISLPFFFVFIWEFLKIYAVWKMQHFRKNDQVKKSKDKQDLLKEWITKRYHAIQDVIWDISNGITTWHSLNQVNNFMAFVSQIESKDVNKTLAYEHWYLVMQEKLNKFERNNLWELVSKPKSNILIWTKWVFHNKLDENGHV